MAFQMRTISMQWRTGIELLCRNPHFKSRLNVNFIPSAWFSNQSTGDADSNDFKMRMWTRIKKNDPDMDYFLSASNTQFRIKELSKCMACSIEDATELVKRDSYLGVADFDRLKDKINLLISNNFSAQDIISNPSILHRRYKLLEHRLSVLKSYECPEDKVNLSILRKRALYFGMFAEKCEEENLLLSQFSSDEDCIAALLECDKSKAKQLVEKFDLTPVLLEDKIAVLKRFNFSSKVIQSNIRVIVNSSASSMEHRLQTLKDENLLNIPHFKLGRALSLETKEFNEYVSVLKKNIKALEGSKDKKEYLIFRLKCSEKVAESLVSRKPIISMNEVKLKDMLDFFLKVMKVSPDFIISNIYLLGYSMKRFHHRWLSISPFVDGNHARTANLLSMSDDRFKKAMEELKV